MTKQEIKVRIAPSPTGYLHVGTARTAIFNWLFARHHKGRFIVRIEDTDKDRSRPELIEPILESMKWLGMDWDEEPFFQSRRMERYPPYVERLLQSGHAYRCFASPDELETLRKQAMADKRALGYNLKDRHYTKEEVAARLETGEPFSVRLRIPEGETSYNDLILGEIKKNNHEIEDLVICRSDGSAVYNLAVVVDDYEMGITHVIRGNDHINNTFKQIHIYQALEIKPPQFAHIPLILRPDKKKVSKRLGDKDVSEYGDDGILAEALFNFLCLLGWSPKDDREILSREEVIQLFKIENVNKANPIFDEDKLLAMNREYIKVQPDEKLAEMVAPLLVKAGYTTEPWLEQNRNYLLKIIAMLRERCARLGDFVSLSEYFFRSEFSYDEKAANKHFTIEGQNYLERLTEEFEKIDDFNKEKLESALDSAATELKVKRASLIHPTRLAVTGISGGPGLFDILEAIGINETIKRMKKAISFIGKKESI